MKKRYNRLRQVRPCYVCGRKGRHYIDAIDNFLSIKNPCLCLACSRTPIEWCEELYQERKRKIDFAKYCRFVDQTKQTNKQIKFSVECVSLPAIVDGGYPMAYYISGDFICGNCIHSVLQNNYLGKQTEIGREIFLEGPSETCTECQKEIESAYGEIENE